MKQLMYQQSSKVMENYPTGKQELARYLAGYPEYAILNRYADTPTDPLLALMPLIKRLQSDPLFLETLHQALVILSRDATFCWMSMYYISNLASQEKVIGMKLLSQEVIFNIKEGLFANQKNLLNTDKWMGAGEKGGLWGDVLR